MKLRILHIVKDAIFTDLAYTQFETAYPGISTYLLPSKKTPLKSIKKASLKRVSRFSFLDKKFIKYLEGYDAIIFHSITPFSLEIIKRINSDTCLVWIGMGYDYYDLIYDKPEDMLEPQTKLLKNKLGKHKLTDYIKLPIKKFLHGLIYNNAKNKKTLLRKISIFSPVLTSEFEPVKNSIADFDATYMKWNYGLNYLHENQKSIGFVRGQNILVGNSAAPNNNHIEIFSILKNLSIPADSKIIVPLSYGDMSYKNEIIAIGKRMFGIKFQPLTQMLEMKEYVDVLASCSIVIFNHKRQQGAGNAGIALFLGAKVFMNPESLLYQEYVDQGLVVFPNSEIENELTKYDLAYLDKDQRLHNRDLILKCRSFDDYLSNTRALVEKIIEIKKTN